MCLANTACDSNGLRQFLIERGTLPVIPNNSTRRRPQPFDKRLYRGRNRIERTISHLRDWRRIAMRYDRLSCTYASAIARALIIRW